MNVNEMLEKKQRLSNKVKEKTCHYHGALAKVVSEIDNDGRVWIDFGVGLRRNRVCVDLTKLEFEENDLNQAIKQMYKKKNNVTMPKDDKCQSKHGCGVSAVARGGLSSAVLERGGRCNQYLVKE